MKTNHLVKFEDFVSEDKLRHKLNDLLKKSAANQAQFVPATNPIVAYLLNVTDITGPKTIYHAETYSFGTDVLYFNPTASILSYLKKELGANHNYKNQVVAKLLAKDAGTFYSAFSELIVAAYLKFLGASIEPNSSKETGKPDLIVTQPALEAHEVKLFADENHWLSSKVNNLLKILVENFKNYSNDSLIVFVKDVRALDKTITSAVHEFYANGDSQLGKNVSVIRYPNYIGNQGYVIRNYATNFQLRIIPSMDFGPAVDKYKRDLEKSRRQMANSGYDYGVTWTYFQSNEEEAITHRLVQEVDVEAINSHVGADMGLVLFHFYPSHNQQTQQIRIEYGISAFNYKGMLNIGQATFREFIDKVLMVQTFPVSS